MIVPSWMSRNQEQKEPLVRLHDVIAGTLQMEQNTKLKRRISKLESTLIPRPLFTQSFPSRPLRKSSSIGREIISRTIQGLGIVVRSNRDNSY
jgi:hypothetical protein